MIQESPAMKLAGLFVWWIYFGILQNTKIERGAYRGITLRERVYLWGENNAKQRLAHMHPRPQIPRQRHLPCLLAGRKEEVA